MHLREFIQRLRERWCSILPIRYSNITITTYSLSLLTAIITIIIIIITIIAYYYHYYYYYYHYYASSIIIVLVIIITIIITIIIIISDFRERRVHPRIIIHAVTHT